MRMAFLSYLRVVVYISMHIRVIVFQIMVRHHLSETVKLFMELTYEI